MFSLKIIRDRAKSVEAEADALVEKHGAGAWEASRHMERQANTVSAALFWRAVGKTLSRRRSAEGMDILLPTRAHNCLSCLAERLSGARESQAPPLPAACIPCLAQRLSGRSSRPILEAQEPEVSLACTPAHHEGSFQDGERQAPFAE